MEHPLIRLKWQTHALCGTSGGYLSAFKSFNNDKQFIILLWDTWSEVPKNPHRAWLEGQVREGVAGVG